MLDVEVSATKKTNLDKLLETIVLQAEVLELKANPDRAAEGTVIEAKLDRGRGPVATVLVQRGTLHVGDIVVAGAEWGRVRALVYDTGAIRSRRPARRCRSRCSASPARPKRAIASRWSRAKRAPARSPTTAPARSARRSAARATGMRGSLEQMMSAAQDRGPQGIPAGHQGRRAGLGRGDRRRAREARHRRGGGARHPCRRRRHHRIRRDAGRARRAPRSSASTCAPTRKRARPAERAGIEIRYYNIIYNLVDDVKKAMSGLLAPERRETMLGNAEILEIFNVSKVGKVAGCRVTDGVVERGANVRLIRDNVVIHEGKLSTLKRFKDEVREVVAGQECGMAFENYQDMRQGDVIECYRVETMQRSL